MTSPTHYRFADFVVDVCEETLCRDGVTFKLRTRTFQVLCLLLENAGRVITKEEFAEKVWHGTFVEENNLTVAVAHIRKVLSETKDAKFIETLPRKGYRFIAKVEKIYCEESTVVEETFFASQLSKTTKNVEEINNINNYAESINLDDEKRDIRQTSANVKNDGENWHQKRSAKNARDFFAVIYSYKILAFAGFAVMVICISLIWQRSFTKIKAEPFSSIAVLRFSSNNNSNDNRILAEKLTQDMTFNLARITDVRVLAYNAVKDFDIWNVNAEKIRADLKIDGLITGEMQVNGEVIEIKVELKDLRNGEIVWGNRYLLKPQDSPESQHIIARDIARRFGADKRRDESFAAANQEAYQAYITARNHLGKETTDDYEKAVDNFMLAIVKDPSFADAHSGLAVAQALQGFNLYVAYGASGSRASFPAAKASANRALQINADSDEALSVIAFINYTYEYDWKQADNNFKRAVGINPNNLLIRRWRGCFFHKSGRFDEGFIEHRNALLLHPNSTETLNDLAWGSFLAGRYDEAIRYCETAQRIDKNNVAALYNASEIYEIKGDYVKGFILWKDAMKADGASRLWINNLEKSFEKDGYRGFVRAKVEWFENLTEKDYVFPTDLARGYVALGENDKAIEWLNKSVAMRVPDILSVKYEPAFNALRGDERFQAVLKQMNLPE